MGRRALPKIDPTLDLSAHLWTLGQLPVPFSSAALFGRTAPLEIEIGSGKGLFLRTAAAARPEHDFLGIELSHKYARFAAAGLAKRAISSAKVLSADAVATFAEILPSETAIAVHVYFPDPWWKKRHRRRRVMRESLLRDVQRVLLPGGVLHFWTDVAEYFETTQELIRAATSLIGPIDVAEAAPQHDLDYRTHFERRTRLHGEAVFRAEFRKGAD